MALVTNNSVELSTKKLVPINIKTRARTDRVKYISTIKISYAFTGEKKMFATFALWINLQGCYTQLVVRVTWILFPVQSIGVRQKMFLQLRSSNIAIYLTLMYNLSMCGY